MRNHNVRNAGEWGWAQRIELTRRRASERIRRPPQTQAEQSVDVVVDVHKPPVLGLMIPDIG